MVTSNNLVPDFLGEYTMSSILNRAATKKFIIAKFVNLRPGMPITRVSQDSLDKLEAKLRAWIVAEVERHPSIGKTFIL